MKYLIGNWKMFNDYHETENFLKEFSACASLLTAPNITIGLAPTAPFLSLLAANASFLTFAQNVSSNNQGAFTGEISADILKSLNVAGALVAHSERRTLFHETDADANAKILQLLKQKLRPVYCVGENWEQKEAGQTLALIKNQLLEGLKGLNKEEASQVIIAYEPVWAIGTGKACLPSDAKEVALYIKKVINDQFAVDTKKVIVLYGGSVNKDNVKSYIHLDGIDGVLVGGASKNAASFKQLIEASLA